MEVDYKEPVHSCPLCKLEYRYNQSYRHFLDCSWNQIKAKRDAIHQPIDNSRHLAGYGLRPQLAQPEVQRG